MSSHNIKHHNYYELLGIDKTASDADIKKAFRKAAMKYHPDKLTHLSEDARKSAESKFATINKAYEVLANPESRAKYDSGALDEHGNETPGAGFTGNPFADFFGGGFPFSMGGMGGNPQKQDLSREKTPPTKITIKVPLAELYTGCTYNHTITRQIKCTECGGCGAKSKAYVKSCQKCTGTGVCVEMRQVGPGFIQQIRNACKACKSTGKYIEPGFECTACKTTRIMQENKTIEIVVKPGMFAGNHITFTGDGNHEPDYGYAGDLIVFLDDSGTSTHGNMRREGSNLVMSRTINLVEALTGTKFMFKHLDGRIIKAEYKNIIKPGQIMKIIGEGMPILGHGGSNTGTYGDLIIHIDIKFPDILDDARKEYIIKILSGIIQTPKKQIWDIELENTPPENIDNVEMVIYEDHKHTNEHHNTQSQSSYNNDNTFENTTPQHGPQHVQCAQQ